jgi:hypothetical protein
MAPKLVNYRADWDNLSDDVCYIDPTPAILEATDDVLKGRQKKPADLTDIEKEAHKSPEHCARVCQYEGRQKGEPEDDLESEDEEEGSQSLRAREPMLDLIKSKEQKRKEKALARKCFQYRYHRGACCTSRSFKLGAPKKGKDDADKWHSGWYVKGINNWVKAMGECTEPRWRQPG